MSNPFEEKISSLFDDELDSAEREQVISQLKQSSEHKETWGRYCLMQEAMKKNLHSDPKHNLFSRISTALESEPVLFAPSNDKTPEIKPEPTVETPQPAEVATRPFGLPSFGWAAAATVAMFAVIGTMTMNNVQDPETQGFDVAKVQKPQNAVPATQTFNVQPNPTFVSTSPNNIPQVMPRADQWERIEQIGGVSWETYIQEHSETAAQGGVQPGVVPFARIVNFEGTAQPQ